jgi:hypothetical protein
MDMKEHDTPKILVHCTVDRTSIVNNGETYMCTKCNRRLLDVANNEMPDRNDPRPLCGIILKAAVAGSLALAGCEKEQGPVGMVEYPKGTIAYPGDAHSAQIVEEIENKQFPTAERSTQDPDRVISPYTGKEVSVEGIPPGSLVTDPDFPMEDQKYFRLPEAVEATDGASE